MRWLLVMMCATPFLPAQPVETVDFSLPPREGLLLGIEVRRESRTSCNDSQCGRDAVHIHAYELKQSIRHRITRVADGRVSSITRRYGMPRGRWWTEMDGRQSELSVRHGLVEQPIRVTWDESDHAKIETKVGDKWYDPSMSPLLRSLPLAELRAPILPIDRAVRRVGETWDADPEILTDVLGGWTLDKVEGHARFTLVSAGVQREGRSESLAELKIDVDVRMESMTPRCETRERLRWTGTALYDLDNRVVVECSGECNSTTRRTVKSESGSFEARSSHSSKTMTTAAVAKRDKW